MKVLDSTNTAIVESVRCKRILLARKAIRCGRHLRKEHVLEEVAHLSRLTHAHIVQVIGTYTLGDNFSILLYPVAEYNLETFMQSLDAEVGIESHYDDYYPPGTELDMKIESHIHSIHEGLREKRFSLMCLFGCLGNAVDHIHGTITKHMDIKPTNILMRNMSGSCNPHQARWKPYIADFGISRSYTSPIAAETEGPTMFTKKYAAPEVVDRQLPVDIFSLGCVFLEVISVVGSSLPISQPQSLFRKLERLLESNEYGDFSYQANISAVRCVLQLPSGQQAMGPG